MPGELAVPAGTGTAQVWLAAPSTVSFAPSWLTQLGCRREASPQPLMPQYITAKLSKFHYISSVPQA